ncbi:MAG: hypothetical protein KUG73_13515 [Pseudomonadales bacterium]|nr:hypothetical protein [Pseudomonadales bacterium]
MPELAHAEKQQSLAYQKTVHNNHWFSENPDKAWAERFFLIYSPIWMLSMAVMMLTGWDKSWGDTALLIHGASIALPLFLVPLIVSLSRTRRGTNTSFVDRVLNSYGLKANLYIFIFGFFGNYIGSEYFFDVLGMIYNYPNATTTLDATLVGHSNQPVPVIMYFYTHAYFMTYHTTAIILLRRIMNSGIPLAGLLFMPLTFAIGYCWAWAETKAMANPLMTTSFYYENMEAMLAYGSIIYATYFIGSFPIFYFIDEKSTTRWDITKVTAAGLSASMIVFYLLELCANYIGSI